MSVGKIIRIDPAPKQFSVSWMLGSRCNYECMYCPAELHDKTSQHHDLSTLKRTWQQVLDNTKHLGLQYKISFTGGEVTTNRNFLPLIEWIRSRPFSTQIFVVSNGSASLGYYRRLAKLVDGISISTHSEFMDEKKFFGTARSLNQIMTRPEKSLHVNIMDEHWNQERIKLYQKFCDENHISYSVNVIDYSQTVRLDIWRQGKANIEQI